MRRTSRWLGLAAALLLAGCSRRAYVIYPPSAPAPPAAACEIDLGSVKPGVTTVGELRGLVQAAATGECPLELAFHVNGQGFDWKGSDPVGDDRIVERLATEIGRNMPFRRAPKIHAIVAALPPPPSPPPPPPSPVQPTRSPLLVTVAPPSLGSPPPLRVSEIVEVTQADDPPIESERPTCGPNAATVGEAGGRAGKAPDPQPTVKQMLPPAAAGGALVYALCYLNVLGIPAAARAAALRPSRLRTPPDESARESSLAPAPPEDGDSDYADRRVRITGRGFEAGS
jgi:hypothetical protein